jgi:hypothetical protein
MLFEPDRHGQWNYGIYDTFWQSAKLAVVASVLHGQISYESIMKAHPEFLRRVSPDA